MRTLALTFALLGLVACVSPNTLDGSKKAPNDGRLSSEALACSDKPDARSYASFDGKKLEDGRVDQNGSANRARFKPFGSLAPEFHRVVGVVPQSLLASGASFDAPDARWYTEAAQSGTSLNAFYDIAFEACSGMVGQRAELAAMPTADSAKDFCSAFMRKAWSRSASPEETESCVDLATNKLSAEPKPQRRWAYTCASILSSSHFLTF